MEVIMKSISTTKRQLPFSNPHQNKAGMTMVEVLVSLTILMIVLGAIFSILNIQQTKAINVQQTTVMQTDANVALTLFRWDLFMAGYGISTENNSIISFDSGVNGGSDQVQLFGAGLAFESGHSNWTPILESAITSTEIKVFRFADSAANLAPGDVISIVDQNKNPLDSNITVVSTDTITHIAGEDSVPALKVTVNPPVSAGMGTIAIIVNNNTYYNGVTYTLNNGQLLRGNEVFLDDVEDIQFAYGLDENDNGIFESSEWWNALTDIPNYSTRLLYEHKFAVRSTFVVLSSSFLRDYEYPFDSLQHENNVYYPSALEKRRKREIVTAISWPRNLQF
jgi:type II secretory pathway pseudopilin PulG